jgi:hypothetical protein
MDDARYLRKQALRCRRLAQSILDAEAVAALEEMAREFDQKAADLERSAGVSSRSDG